MRSRKSRGHASCRVEINPDKNEILVFEQHLVVPDEGYELEADPALKQMKLSEAKKIKARIKVGDILEESVNPKEFSQTAVVNLKNVLNQNLKNIEKDNVYNHFKSKEKEMVIAKVIGEDDEYYRLDLGKRINDFITKKRSTTD